MTSVQQNKTVSELQQATIVEAERCISLAEIYFGRQFHLDAIHFDLRGRTAGQFRIKRQAAQTGFKQATLKKELRFNAELLERYRDQFIVETVGHEVAHFVVSEVYKKRVRPHGKEWRAVMQEVLNQNPDVTHSYETQPVRKLARFAYACHCKDKTHELTSIRHQRIQKGQAKYLCKQCSQMLSPLKL